jgi:hypothetical protein
LIAQATGIILPIPNPNNPRSRTKLVDDLVAAADNATGKFIKPLKRFTRLHLSKPVRWTKMVIS